MFWLSSPKPKFLQFSDTGLKPLSPPVSIKIANSMTVFTKQDKIVGMMIAFIVINVMDFVSFFTTETTKAITIFNSLFKLGIKAWGIRSQRQSISPVGIISTSKSLRHSFKPFYILALCYCSLPCFLSPFSSPRLSHSFFSFWFMFPSYMLAHPFSKHYISTRLTSLLTRLDFNTTVKAVPSAFISLSLIMIKQIASLTSVESILAQRISAIYTNLCHIQEHYTILSGSNQWN